MEITLGSSTYTISKNEHGVWILTDERTGKEHIGMKVAVDLEARVLAGEKPADVAAESNIWLFDTITRNHTEHPRFAEVHGKLSFAGWRA